MEEVKRLNVLEVVVIATMSSGESTLINSFLGKSLMSARNEATTATVTKVYQANQDFYEVRALDQNNNVITDWKIAILEKVQQYNENSNMYTIELRGPLKLHSSENVDIVLVDTPGPNNSQDISHRKSTFEYIKSKEIPFILYVLNATQLGIKDAAALLQVLQREKTISNEQFIFVLNKIDALDPEKESIKHVMKNAKRYLIKNGIENPRVFPVTAKFEQLLRMNANSGELSRRDERTLRNHEYLEEDYNLVNHAMLSKEERKEVIQDIEKLRESGDELGVSLYYTGVPLLEKKITNYIETFGTSYLLSKVQQKILKSIEEELHKIADIKKMIESLE